jgi:hypothetical protein
VGASDALGLRSACARPVRDILRRTVTDVEPGWHAAGVACDMDAPIGDPLVTHNGQFGTAFLRAFPAYEMIVETLFFTEIKHAIRVKMFHDNPGFRDHRAPART